MKVLVRVMVAQSGAALQSTADALVASVGGICEALQTEPYGPLPDCHEIWFRCETGQETGEAAIDQVSAALGTGWHFGSEELTRFAVWSPADAHTFAVPDVRFANLEVWTGDLRP